VGGEVLVDRSLARRLATHFRVVGIWDPNLARNVGQIDKDAKNDGSSLTSLISRAAAYASGNAA
jgi:hypothetical protein